MSLTVTAEDRIIDMTAYVPDKIDGGSFIRNKNNVFICFLLMAYFILIVNINCSYEKFGSFQINDKILALKKGDLVFITLKNSTQIKGIFIEQEKDKIIIGKVENGVMKQESVKIGLIYRIQKQKKSHAPNVFITAGLFLLVIGLFAYTSLLASLGNFN
ncbi:MAG: hypothetical protein ACTSWG_06955 [Candidatus Helarchaeota archaeon]